MTDIDIKHKYSPYISTNDYKGLSVVVPILGCNKDCGWCFNSETLAIKRMDTEHLRVECSKFIEDVKVFVFGGNDALGPCYSTTYNLTSFLKNNDCKIVLQIRNITKARLKKICKIRPDEIHLTLNEVGKNTVENIKKVQEEFLVETKVVYIPGRTNYPKDIHVNAVQQFIPGECLDPEYNKIKQPSRDEVMEFAKKIGADEIITKENGREKV